MNNLFGLLLICLLVTSHTSKAQIDTFKDCWSFDLTKNITPLGAIIDLRKEGKNYYFLYWGNDKKLRKLADTFFCYYNPSQPTFIAENQQYIIMRNACGTSCINLFILPLNDHLSPRVYNNYAGYELDKEIIVYPVYTNNKFRLVIENFKTGRKQIISTNDMASGAIATSDDIQIKIANDSLFYTYPVTVKGTTLNVTKKIKLNIL